MTKWKQVRAGDLRPGDKTKFGTGYERNWRTVSEVRYLGNGIVRVKHRETWEPFYEEFADTYLVEVVDV